MDEGNPSATKTTLIVAQEVPHGSLERHFRTSSLPKGAARLSWATLSHFFVAQGYSTARLGDTFVHLRRPRVQHGSLGQHFRTFSSPEGPARHSWATLSYIFVARGCSTARLSDTFVHLRRPRVQHGTLRATPPRVSAARRYWAKDVRLNLTKKEEVSQKTRETSVGCPKPGSNRHVFKGHWILVQRVYQFRHSGIFMQ